VNGSEANTGQNSLRAIRNYVSAYGIVMFGSEFQDDPQSLVVAKLMGSVYQIFNVFQRDYFVFWAASTQSHQKM